MRSEMLAKNVRASIDTRTVRRPWRWTHTRHMYGRTHACESAHGAFGALSGAFGARERHPGLGDMPTAVVFTQGWRGISRPQGPENGSFPTSRSRLPLAPLLRWEGGRRERFVLRFVQESGAKREEGTGGGLGYKRAVHVKFDGVKVHSA